MTRHPELIVSVSGIRGIVGRSLTPDAAVRFAQAFGSSHAGATILVSRDSRPSGQWLGHAVTAGLQSVGCRVGDLGIAPTPTVGVAVTAFRAAGAIQITASHNPSPWNGLKMFGPDGAVLPAAAGQQVRDRFDRGNFESVPWDRVGTSIPVGDAVENHVDRVLKLVPVGVIRAKSWPVLVDANGGAGGPAAQRLLDHLGCRVIPLGMETDGRFAHEPEPTPAHLTGIAPLVPMRGAAIGFVLDPDADRLALIDERGRCLSEELTLALAVKQVLKSATGPVVVNMSTSRVIEDLAKAAGCQFARSAVGEANVVERMRSGRAVIGGEGNGGVIDPRVGWVRDPFVGMALILALMTDEQKPLSQLADDLPTYAMLKTKMTVAPERLTTALETLAATWPGVTLNREDGLRIDGPDWWLHVRASNTEPVVRAIAEAPTESQARALCDRAAAVLC